MTRTSDTAAAAPDAIPAAPPGSTPAAPPDSTPAAPPDSSPAAPLGPAAEAASPGPGEAGRRGFATDAELHRRDAPRHCPRCGESLTSGIAVEFWQGADRIFHTWCAYCRWTGDIIPVTTMIGHEPEH